MKITKISCFELRGKARDPIAVFETPHPYLGDAEQTARYRHPFTMIETDQGISGLCYGGTSGVKELGQLIVGENPLRIQYLWEKLYNATYYRLKYHQDIATLDLALWDLAGKARNESVLSLLGGPVQDEIPAYAAMLGFSPDPRKAAERSAEWVKKGFRALKWYLPYNACASSEGLRENVAIVQAVRKMVGDEIAIMIDFGVSDPTQNSLLYMTELARELEPYGIRWLEEPLNYDDLDAYKRLAESTSIPIALGERWYSLSQIKQIIEHKAASVIQPDIRAAFGMTEMLRITTFASAYGIPLIPHANESCRQTLHLLFSSPRRVCPMAEWGVKINHNAQYFYKEFYEPIDGCFRLPTGPGFGCEIDFDKVEERIDL